MGTSQAAKADIFSGICLGFDAQFRQNKFWLNFTTILPISNMASKSKQNEIVRKVLNNLNLFSMRKSATKVFHGAVKFWNDEILEKIDAAEGFRPLNSWNSLAGAISMPCGAPTFHPTWFVEWLHRRVISSTGALARRKAVVRSGCFRTLSFISVTVNDVIVKSFEIVWSARASRRFPASITVRRCETRKLYVAKQPGPWTGNFEMTKFSRKLTLLRGSGF